MDPTERRSCAVSGESRFLFDYSSFTSAANFTMATQVFVDNDFVFLILATRRKVFTLVLASSHNFVSAPFLLVHLFGEL